MANQTTYRLRTTDLADWLVPVSEGKDGAKGSGRAASDVADYFEENFGLYFTSQRNGLRGIVLPKNAHNYAEAFAEFEKWNEAGIRWNHILVEAGVRKASSGPIQKTDAEKAEVMLKNALETDTKDGKAPNLGRIKVIGGKLAARFPALDADTRSNLFEKLYRAPMLEKAKAFLGQ